LNLYLDASVLMPAVIEEPSSSAVRELFRNRPDDLSVGDFAAAEVASALSRLVRMERLTATEGAERLADFDEWRVSATEVAEMDAHDCRLANTYVRRFDLKLRAKDALHAAICRRLELQLATLDRRLAAAARVLGINVVVPTD
jgi:predicted nucleic acid-binding protein